VADANWSDVHLDSFYRPGTSEDKACHRGKGAAGYLGAAGSDCDSPRALINETLDWIEKNLKDQMDFVIWTGDSARHDNDEDIPRTEKQIEEFNQVLVDGLVKVFSTGENNDPLIPIVPNLGNNDIMPHNIFSKGPNTWTKKYAKMWKSFIPEEQRHTFVEGGWFWSEVIPGRLAVISLNTMYFFDSNSAVGGCKAKSEPGYQHMEWLRVQLQLMRNRGLKAILMGHVPPARTADRQAWDETCWQKYALWMLQYRDVVVGSLYGHMNIDHFILQDTEDITIVDWVDEDQLLESQYSIRDADDGDELTTQSRTSYLTSLREEWTRLPSPPPGVVDLRRRGRKEEKFLKKIGGPFAERYAMSLVSPSVVPNYYPTLRVFEYNITGIEDSTTWSARDPGTEVKDASSSLDKNSKFKIPEPPSPSAPPGPAYSNQPLTFLSYTQYYANITRLEETTSSKSDGQPVSIEFEVEYNTRDDDIYQMEDLTVRSFFELAKRIAEDSADQADRLATDDEVDPSKKKHKKKKKKKKKHHRNKAWYAFLRRAFVGILDDDELEDIAS
jgi:endopolyphosphatase